MTIVHIVLFKFQEGVSEFHKERFVSELKKLKDLPCVLNSSLVVGGPSVTTPIERSKGFHYALVSYHKDTEALAQYQASDEHHRRVERMPEIMRGGVLIEDKSHEHVSLAVSGGRDTI